jgi:hypothetical protein
MPHSPNWQRRSMPMPPQTDANTNKLLAQELKVKLHWLRTVN